MYVHCRSSNGQVIQVENVKLHTYKLCVSGGGEGGGAWVQSMNKEKKKIKVR